MLKNPIYRGEIVHKGKAFPGEHAAIVDEDLWRRVQSRLEENRMERREGDKALEPSLLAGIVFDASSEPMTPTHAAKKGTRYRYYISTGPASDNSRGQRVPAPNLEALIIGRLRALLADPVEFLNARELEQIVVDRLQLMRQRVDARDRETEPERYRRMAANAFAFLRGAAAVMANDLARQPKKG